MTHTTTTYTQHLQPLCDTTGKQLWDPHVNKGFPLYGISPKTTLWADRTPTYTQHVEPLYDTQPLYGTKGTQLSGPHVNKGFPYMKYHTESATSTVPAKKKWCSIFYMGSTRSMDRSKRKIKINISIWSAWDRSSVPVKRNNVNPIWAKKRHVIHIDSPCFEPRCQQNKRLKKPVEYDLVHHN